MRFAYYFAALLAVITSTGCFWHRHKQAPPPAVTQAQRPGTNASAAPSQTFVISTDESLSGHVATVNETLKFAVLTFPVGKLPAVDSRMNVFRNGAIVGEVKISGPQRDDNTVADIVLGDAQSGDEVRAK
jgi:hypothetical protein